MCGRSSAVGLVLERWIDFTYRSSTDADGLSDAEIDQAVFGGDGQRVAQTVRNDVRRYDPAGDADQVTCCGSPFTARPGGCRRPTVTREANAGRCAGQASAGIRLARSFDERWTRRANQHRTAAGVRCSHRRAHIQAREPLSSSTATRAAGSALFLTGLPRGRAYTSVCEEPSSQER